MNRLSNYRGFRVQCDAYVGLQRGSDNSEATAHDRGPRTRFQMSAGVRSGSLVTRAERASRSFFLADGNAADVVVSPSVWNQAHSDSQLVYAHIIFEILLNCGVPLNQNEPTLLHSTS